MEKKNRFRVPGGSGDGNKDDNNNGHVLTPRERAVLIFISIAFAVASDAIFTYFASKGGM